MMEKAAPPALGGQFNISVDNIQVTVVESRRLSEDVRRLAGTFAIAFVITVPPGKAAALAVKVEAAKTAPDTFKKEFATVAKAQLVAAGVPQATVDKLSVSAITVTATYKPMTTGTGTATGSTDGAYQGAASMVVIIAIAIKMLFWGM